MNLSEHFTLEEMVYSPTAARLGLDNTCIRDLHEIAEYHQITMGELIEQMTRYHKMKEQAIPKYNEAHEEEE